MVLVMGVDQRRKGGQGREGEEAALGMGMGDRFGCKGCHRNAPLVLFPTFPPLENENGYRYKSFRGLDMNAEERVADAFVKADRKYMHDQGNVLEKHTRKSVVGLHWRHPVF